jgi:CheY-like chemotaxis protein
VCIEAVNGLDAIAKAEVARPDLIILDLSMPEMDGFEAATILHI